MQFTTLLGRHLKDDAVVALLEEHEIEVIYDFDRTHEGMEDRYWAGSKERGFLLRFSQEQRLDTIFLYIQPREGYAAIDVTGIDVPVYQTYDDAVRACTREGIRYTHSGEIAGNRERWWIKLDRGTWTSHYQYGRNERLKMITLAVADLGG